MLKGFKFPSANGNSLTITETEKANAVVIAIVRGADQFPLSVELTEAEWKEFCELKYHIEFKPSDVRPPILDQLQTNPAGERVAGEEF